MGHPACQEEEQEQGDSRPGLPEQSDHQPDTWQNPETYYPESWQESQADPW
jgi:hypothetical protein